MAKKICIDAGHYGKYNQSPCNKKYYESDMVWKLHLLQKKYLEAYGFEIILTRESQEKDLSLYNRGAKSKGCDLFISDHSNAVGSGANENIDYPVVYCSINGKGNALGKKLADCIASVMGTKQKGRIESRQGNNGDYYGVIRGATAVGTVGMILEHGFHTNTKCTNWLLKDENLDKLAKAEADVIAEYFGMKKINNSTNTSSTTNTVNNTNTSNYLTGMYRVNVDELNIRNGAGTSYKVVGAIKDKGTYTIVEMNGTWGKLKSGAGWINCSNKYCTYVGNVDTNKTKEFKIKVIVTDLNIRNGAGTNHKIVGCIKDKGVYTIVKTSGSWGYLKSGAGWINISSKYVKHL